MRETRGQGRKMCERRCTFLLTEVFNSRSEAQETLCLARPCVNIPQLRKENPFHIFTCLLRGLGARKLHHIFSWQVLCHVTQGDCRIVMPKLVYHHSICLSYFNDAHNSFKERKKALIDLSFKYTSLPGIELNGRITLEDIQYR